MAGRMEREPRTIEPARSWPYVYVVIFGTNRNSLDALAATFFNFAAINNPVYEQLRKALVTPLRDPPLGQQKAKINVRKILCVLFLYSLPRS